MNTTLMQNPEINQQFISKIPLGRWGRVEEIGALALYCSDGRWGEAFDDFCHKHLQIPRYDRWAVPGGPGCLVRPDAGPGYCQAAREQLDFLVRVHKLEQLVLITHYGCAYYGHRLEQSAKECLPAARSAWSKPGPAN